MEDFIGYDNAELVEDEEIVVLDQFNNQSSSSQINFRNSKIPKLISTNYSSQNNSYSHSGESETNNPPSATGTGIYSHSAHAIGGVSKPIKIHRNYLGGGKSRFPVRKFSLLGTTSVGSAGGIGRARPRIRKSRAKRSIVHEHFVFNSEEQRYYCLHCPRSYVKSKDSTTSSLQLHLRTKHPLELFAVHTTPPDFKEDISVSNSSFHHQVDNNYQDEEIAEPEQNSSADYNTVFVESNFEGDPGDNFLEESDDGDSEGAHFPKIIMSTSLQDKVNVDGPDTRKHHSVDVKKLPVGYTLGVIGGGNMAQAIMFGLFDIGAVEPASVIVSGTSIARLDKWTKYGCTAVTDNVHLIDVSNVVIWAVKPQMFSKVLDAITNHPNRSPDKLKGKLHISVMAGIPVQKLEQNMANFFFPKDNLNQSLCHLRVAKVNPNLALKVKAGSAVYCLGAACTTDDEEVIKILFSQTGICFRIEESQSHAYGALVGCGLGFMFPLLEAMSDGAVKVGLQREPSLKLAAQVMKGAAELFLQEGTHPAVWKDRVCSPGGTTIAGIAELEKYGARNAIINAIEASTKRSEELGNK